MPLSDTELEILIKKLDSPVEGKRWAAREYILSLPDAEATEIIFAMSRKSPDTTTTFKQMACSLMGALLLFSLFIPLALMSDEEKRTGAIIAFSIILLSLMRRFAHQALLIRRDHQLYLQLPRCRDARFVEPALISLTYFYGSAEIAVKHSLQHNLPLLTKEEAQTFAPREQKMLRNLILLHNPPLNVAVLEALARIEDTGAIPNVERVLKTAGDNEVRTAAEACLIQLNAAKAAERESGILLRPSQNTDGEKTLLRPTTVKPEDENELLRPSDEEEQ